MFGNDHRKILMVRHLRRDGSTYWQLPGGGLLPGESHEEAVLRELREETGLDGTVKRELFTIPYKYGLSTTFLVTVSGNAEPVLGVDPEDADSDHQKLVEIAWRPFAPSTGSAEVARLLEIPELAPRVVL